MSIPYAEAALQRCSRKKGSPKIRSKSTEEHLRRCVIPTKPLCSFIEVTLQCWHSPTNLSHKSLKHPPTRVPPKECIRVIQKS